jgi:hypothetical protein
VFAAASVADRPNWRTSGAFADADGTGRLIARVFCVSIERQSHRDCAGDDAEARHCDWSAP